MTLLALALACGLGAAADAAPKADAVLVGPGAGKPVDARGIVFDLRWRKPVVRTGVFREVNTSFGRPAISERFGRVIVGTGEGEVVALRLRDGKVDWTYVHGAPFETAATLVDIDQPSGAGLELVLLGSRDGNLLAIEAGSGKLRWTLALGGDMRAPVRVVGARGVVTTASNRVMLVDLRDGKLLWTASHPVAAPLTVVGHSRATVHEGVVYATFADGYVEAFALEEGASLWSRPLSLKVTEFVDADADPVVAGGLLFVASYSDGVYALDPKDGSTRWSVPAPSVTSLGHASRDAEGVVIAASADGFVWGLAPSDGRVLYRTRFEAGPTSRMHVAHGLSVLTAGTGLLLVIDAMSGKPLQATPLGAFTAGEPMWTGDELAVLASSGHVLSLRRAAAAAR